MFKIKSLNRKWYTLIELIIVITLIGILWTIFSSAYNYYISQSKNEKRMNAVKMYWMVLTEVIWRNWDIPTSYCSNDGWANYNSLCFTDNWCTPTISCNATNNYCKQVWTYYFDFNKLASDYSYNIPATLQNPGENFPSGFNFKLCPRAATISAYVWTPIPTQAGYLWAPVTTTNPSFILQFVDTDWTNRVISRHSEWF